MARSALRRLVPRAHKASLGSPHRRRGARALHPRALRPAALAEASETGRARAFGHAAGLRRLPRRSLAREALRGVDLSLVCPRMLCLRRRQGRHGQRSELLRQRGSHATKPLPAADHGATVAGAALAGREGALHERQAARERLGPRAARALLRLSLGKLRLCPQGDRRAHPSHAEADGRTLRGRQSSCCTGADVRQDPRRDRAAGVAAVDVEEAPRQQLARRSSSRGRALRTARRPRCRATRRAS